MIGRFKSVLFLCAAIACVATFNLAANAEAKRALITQKIDESQLITLVGNTRPELNELTDRGPVSANLQRDDTLLLQRSPELEKELEQFIENQHNSSSSIIIHDCPLLFQPQYPGIGRIGDVQVHILIWIVLEPAIHSWAKRYRRGGSVAGRKALLGLNGLVLALIGDGYRIDRVRVQQIDSIERRRAAGPAAICRRWENRHHVAFGVPGNSGPVSKRTCARGGGVQIGDSAVPAIATVDVNQMQMISAV